MNLPNFASSIWATASYSLLLSVYFNLFCVLLGAAILTPRNRTRLGPLLFYPLAWICGAYVHIVAALVLAFAHALNPLMLLAAHGLLLSFTALRHRDAVNAFSELRSAGIAALRRTPRCVLTFLCTVGPFIGWYALQLIIASSPPTKIDAVTYHIPYAKFLLIGQSIPTLYSPYEVLASLLGTQTLWVWFFAAGAEYGPAVTSLLLAVACSIILYVWTLPRIGTLCAWAAAILSTISIFRLTLVAAPEDNSTNAFCIMLFTLLTLEIVERKKDGRAYNALLNALTLLAVFCLLVKTTSLFFTASILFALYVGELRLRRLGKETAAVFGLCVAALIPFFARNYIAYQNPFFPMLLSVFGAADFDIEHLKTVLKVTTYNPERARSIASLVYATPWNYLRNEFFQAQLLVFAFGLYYLLRQRNFILPGAFLAAYLTSFWLVPDYYPRFYLGAIDVTCAFGVLQLYRIAQLLGERYLKLQAVRVDALCVAAFTAYGWGVVVVSWVYGLQFVDAVVGNRPKLEFLRENVEMIETIKWVNENLPAGSRLLVTNRGRYYFNFLTETSTPASVLGRPTSIIRDHAAFAELLHKRGITHVVAAEHLKKNPLHKEYRPILAFLANTQYAERIYLDKNEILIGFRWQTDLEGRSHVYRLLPPGTSPPAVSTEPNLATGSSLD